MFAIEHADGNTYLIDADSFEMENGHHVFYDEDGEPTHSVSSDLVSWVGPADEDDADEADVDEDADIDADDAE